MITAQTPAFALFLVAFLTTMGTAKLRARLDAYENSRKTTCFFETTTISSDGMFLSGLFLVKENITNIDRIDAKLYQCRDNMVLSTCRYFNTLKLGPNVCHMLTLKDMLWSPWFGNFEPPMPCPIPKGSYFLRNGTVDLKKIELLHLPRTQWRVGIDWYNGDQLHYSGVYVSSLLSV